MGSYVPSTAQERQEMLASIGLCSIDELFSHIPDSLKLKGELNLPSGKSELEVCRTMEHIAAQNIVFDSIFRGAGAYDHYIPAIVKSVTGKEEFVTAYTPYQAEISQGVLQSIFEYQTMICELTGMDVSNASVYDGATAAAEAVNMCCERSRNVVFCSAAAHPDTIEVVKTYCWAAGHTFVLVPVKDGKTDIDSIVPQLDKKTTACLYVQSPNFFGQIEDVEKAAETVHSVGVKLIMGCNPIALGLLKTPAELGADIAEILGRKNWGKGVRLTITEDDRLYIECNIVAVYGYAVVNVARAVQENVTSAVESMTGLHVTEVNVNICGITVEQK